MFERELSKFRAPENLTGDALRQDNHLESGVPPSRELRDYHKEMCLRFSREEAATIRRLSLLQQRLREQQNALRDIMIGYNGPYPAQPVKLDRVKFLTREVESLVTKTKVWNSGQLSGLDSNQAAIEDELEGLEQNISAMKISVETEEKKCRPPPHSNHLQHKQSSDQELVVMVGPQEEFHVWLARHRGLAGGWTQDDHLVLVKLTHRFANWRRKPERFIDEVWAGVKAVDSREEVYKHVDWFIEYCTRRDRQKALIDTWRLNRIQRQRSHSEPSLPVKKLRRSRSSDGALEGKRDKKDKIDQWKKIKQVKKEVEETEELLRIAEKKAMLEERMERRNKQLKDFLRVREERRKAEREREEEERRFRDMENKRRKEFNRKLLSRYQEKDMERIQVKLQQKQEENIRREIKRREEEEKAKRPVLARREFDSVLRNTKTVEQKCQANRERISLLYPRPQTERFRRKSIDAGDIYHLENLPKLAVPAWRTLL